MPYLKIIAIILFLNYDTPQLPSLHTDFNFTKHRMDLARNVSQLEFLDSVGICQWAGNEVNGKFVPILKMPQWQYRERALHI